ncbi:MAG: tyrosine-type recombinase/integrase [Rubrivivax sp.]
MPVSCRGELLRAWWRQGRPAVWLFASRQHPDQPLCPQTAQRWYRGARARAGITKRGGINGLRHAFATYELEAGSNLYKLQQWFGHGHISTTMCYLHLARAGALGDAGHGTLSLLAALPAAPPGTARAGIGSTLRH